MRIQFIIPPTLSTDNIVGGFAKNLQEVLCSSFGAEAVSEHPDLLHAFGTWQSLLAKAVGDAHKRRIPVVYSPLGGLTPWHISHNDHAGQRVQKQTVRMADIVHAAGPEEQKAILQWADDKQKIILLPNPIITSTITFQQVAKVFYDEYEQLLTLHDKKVVNEITRQTETLEEKDDIIRHIIFSTLYLHYWYCRGTLPAPLLNNLTNYLVTHDYEEDIIPSALDAVNMRAFFQHILYVLSTVTPLTEGFMPIQAVKDKQSEAMCDMVFKAG